VHRKVFMNETTLVGLPGGELFSQTLQAFKTASIPLTNGGNDRTYKYQFSDPSNKPDLGFLAIRTKDAIRFLNDPRSNLKAVIVGKDIALSEDSEWTFEFPPFYPQAGLYVAATPNWTMLDQKKPKWSEINNTIIFSPYPSIAQKWAKGKGIDDVEIEYAAGKIEGLWRAFPLNYLDIDVKSDKDKEPRTGLANQLIELENLDGIDITMVMVTRPNLLTDDALAISYLINQFKELYVTA